MLHLDPPPDGHMFHVSARSTEHHEIVEIDARFAGCATALDFRKAVNRRDHVGGTSTKRVRAAIRTWTRRLG